MPVRRGSCWGSGAARPATAAVGGRLVRGFDVVAEQARLDDAVTAADVVMTGEGRVDASSFDGKVVGGVVARCRASGTTCVVIAGDIVVDVDVSASRCAPVSV